MIFDVCFFFYFDPLLILEATSQTHATAAVFQLHRSPENQTPINLIRFVLHKIGIGGDMTD